MDLTESFQQSSVDGRLFVVADCGVEYSNSNNRVSNAPNLVKSDNFVVEASNEYPQ